MKITKPYIKELIFHTPEGYTIEKWIEAAGRTCYASRNKTRKNSASKFIRKIRKLQHHSVLEHATASAILIGDIGMSRELIRHRIASYAERSTRYVKSPKKFGHIHVIEPPGLDKEGKKIFQWAAIESEIRYKQLIELGYKPEIARSVLPIGLETEIVVTANLREFRHIFNMRCSKAAHPTIRTLFLTLLEEFNKRLPSIYEDLYNKFLVDN